MEEHWLQIFYHFIHRVKIQTSFPFFLFWPLKFIIFNVSIAFYFFGFFTLILEILYRLIFGGSISHKESYTSRWASEARYNGNLIGLCDDNMSVYFLSISQKCMAISKIIKSLVYNSYPIGLIDLNVSGRCHFGDSILQNISPDIQQIVIIGAGNDTRFYRIPLNPTIKLFEIDAPTSQRNKTKQFFVRNNTTHNKIIFVETNFQTDTWFEKLHKSGFELSKKTLFIREGVTYYLSNPVIRNILQSISQCATGSKLILDYASPIQSGWFLNTILFYFQLLGEPWLSLFSDAEIKELLLEYSLNIENSPMNARNGIKSMHMEKYRSCQFSTPISMRLISTTVASKNHK